MKNRIIKAVFSVLVTMTMLSGNAQKLDIDWIELTERNVVIHYDLLDDNGEHQYLVQLFSSQDNFAAPLTRVKGDYGTEVKPGKDRKIVWDITKELGGFKGNLTFEVRGRVFIPFVRIKELNEGLVLKRGKNHPLLWTSGNTNGQVNIELFNDAQERVWGENNLPNSGKYDWYVPGVKKGSNYRLKFTNTKDRNDIVFSAPFTIKPRTPLLLKVGGVAVLGGAAVFLGGAKSSGNTPTTPTAESLPDPAPHPN